MRRLLAEMERVSMPDPALGLPLALWPIPDEDLADIMQGYPQGYYQNGGRTHSQARRFVMGLYAVGGVPDPLPAKGPLSFEICFSLLCLAPGFHVCFGICWVGSGIKPQTS